MVMDQNKLRLLGTMKGTTGHHSEEEPKTLNNDWQLVCGPLGHASIPAPQAWTCVLALLFFHKASFVLLGEGALWMSSALHW